MIRPERSPASPPGTRCAANCIRIKDRVLMAAGYQTVRRGIAERGYEITELEMSEHRKLDGGLSCLSLRLPEVEP